MGVLMDQRASGLPAGDLVNEGGRDPERQHAASELPQVHVHGAEGRHHLPGSLPGHRLRGVILLPHSALLLPCMLLATDARVLLPDPV